MFSVHLYRPTHDLSRTSEHQDVIKVLVDIINLVTSLHINLVTGVWGNMIHVGKHGFATAWELIVF